MLFYILHPIAVPLCSFEHGLCGWYHESDPTKADLNWTMWNNDSPAWVKNPKADHTFNSINGSLNSYFFYRALAEHAPLQKQRCQVLLIHSCSILYCIFFDENTSKILQDLGKYCFFLEVYFLHMCLAQWVNGENTDFWGFSSKILILSAL